VSDEMSGLTEADVRRYISGTYFERGEHYYCDGRILDTIRRGTEIQACCEGSQYEPYRVSATLGSTGILSDDCSCPIGGGCKHVVALLLTWANEPESFTERPTLDAALAAKSKDELIALVLQMLKRSPDLEPLLDLPLMTPSLESAGHDAGPLPPVDPEPYRRLVRRAMYKADNWDAVWGSALEIGSVVDVADGLAAQGDWSNARSLYEVVIDEVLSEYETTHDEGQISMGVDRSVEGLGQCLANADDPAVRGDILGSLFEVVAWNVTAGGLGVGESVPAILLDRATPEERQEVRRWILAELEALPEEETRSRRWRPEAWAGLLLRIDELDGDIEGFLERAQRHGLYRSAFGKLTELGRLDEAVQLARDHMTSSAADRLWAADGLEAVGRGDEAMELVEAGLSAGEDVRLAAWVGERYEQRGDVERALAMNLITFGPRPSLEVYKTLERLATATGRWPTLRAELLAQLDADANLSVLAEVHLYEGTWNAAWEVADRDRRGRIRLHVALASEAHRPDRAMRAYLDAVEGLIESRGRDNYAEAARWLLRVRGLHRMTGRQDEWQHLIGDLRTRHKRLPALQDELNQAGL